MLYKKPYKIKLSKHQQEKPKQEQKYTAIHNPNCLNYSRQQSKSRNRTATSYVKKTKNIQIGEMIKIKTNQKQRQEPSIYMFALNQNQQEFINQLKNKNSSTQAKSQLQRIVIGKATFNNSIKQKTLTKRMHDALQLYEWNTCYQKFSKWRPIFQSMTTSTIKLLTITFQGVETIIQDIKHIYFSNLRFLDLRGNRLINIEQLQFINFSNLTSLHLNQQKESYQNQNRIRETKILVKIISSQKFQSLKIFQRNIHYLRIPLPRIRFDHQASILKNLLVERQYAYIQSPRQIQQFKGFRYCVRVEGKDFLNLNLKLEISQKLTDMLKKRFPNSLIHG